ncbi:MAG: DNA polymerase IV [Candidatus Omnitrophota bacterium]|nr:DNA polymerase IV [Candidatus Omnitrophota bacterium]
MSEKERYIAHIDMDAFFASIEQRDDPSLKGKPVVIGADPKLGQGRGVVSTCSYEARKFGIHSSMPISIAYKKCPHAVFIRPDMEKYSGVSENILSLLEKFTPDIEPVSVDEAFLDITNTFHHFGSPVETCRKIKSRIKERTGLTSSMGLASVKMVAKIASDIQKPDGLVVVPAGTEKDFLGPLPIERLWGIGAKTAAVLHNMGIYKIGDISRRSPNELTEALGEIGTHIWELANGIDEREIESQHEAKSVSNEYTFEKDVSDMNTIKDALMRISEKVSYRLRADHIQGKTITLRIRFSNFSTYTRSRTIGSPTNFAEDLYKTSLDQLGEFDIGPSKCVRLLGVRVSNLSDMYPENDLFTADDFCDKKKKDLHMAIDKIIDKFGEGSVRKRR